MAKKDTSYAKKSIDPAGRLTRVLNNLAADTAEKPKKVLEQLYPYFEQHAWLQVRNESERDSIRNRIGALMTHSFYKIGKPDNARWVQYVIDTEKAMFAEEPQSEQKSKR